MMNFEYNGKNISYNVHGDSNEVLVLLNGIMMSQQSWNPFMDNFTKVRKIVTLDLYDQGLSDKMDNEYSIEDQADLVVALLEFLNISKFDLFGISYGGHVSLNIACKYPTKVDKLMLFNCLPNTNELLRDIGNSWISVAKTYDPEAFYYTTIPVIYSTNFYVKHFAWIDARRELLKPVFNKDFLDSMIRLIKSGESHDVRDKLGAIKANTLVVGASDDLLTAPKLTKSIADGIDNSKYIELSDCGHASMYERPNEFLSLILGFLTLEDISII